ncbi:hypothetical protein [Umezawaea sp. Da 62-37]|uniref:DUF7507 domain-containing protein n=1 Tax=Umezawaea sp. Da 62-37 TaxID=3075927 RepID=UPI0028F6FEF1|nr:hypothetical protein [Umezawaea sp. Da 62-37]WNV87935.1 hypothetical protein RM788_06515 [Umezawaea sp. Da 62-37]
MAFLVLSSLTGPLGGVSSAQPAPLQARTYDCPQDANGNTGTTTNPYYYTVPEGTMGLDVIVKGNRGGPGNTDGGDEGAASGGAGAVLRASLDVSPGDVLQVYLACNYGGYHTGGFGGSGQLGGEAGGNGGGSSAIVAANGLALVMEAAGGGGGGGDANNDTNGGDGGNGGIKGFDGSGGNGGASGGTGGSTSAGNGNGGGNSYNGWVGVSGGGGGGGGCVKDGQGTGGGGTGGEGAHSVTDATGGGGGGGASCVRDFLPGQAEEVYSYSIEEAANNGPGQVVLQPARIALAGVSSTVVDLNGSGRDDAGDAIDYTYAIENEGTTTVNSVAVTSTPTAPATTAPVVTCAATPVAPGGTATCTARYAVTTADINVAKVRTTATASARSALGAQLKSSAVVDDTALDRLPELTITGGGTIADQGRPLRPDDPVSVTFTVENTGNTSAPVGLNVHENDPVTAQSLAVCPDGTGRLTLDPGQKATCTSTYRLVQADIDRGSVAFDVYAAGQIIPFGVLLRGELKFTVPIAQSSGITATGSATLVDADQDGLYRPGDRIDYKITIADTGNTTLHTVSAVGDVVGKGDTKIVLTGCPNTGDTTLDPLLQLVCTGSYTLTQGDIDAGVVSYSPVVSGTTAQGTAVLPAGAIALTTELPKVASIDLTAKVQGVDDRNGNGKNDANDVVTYEVVVKNTGTTTLADIALYDMLGDSVLDFRCTPEIGAAMAPGATSTCTAAYTIRPEDTTVGSLAYTPTLSGDSPVAVTTKSNTAEVPLVQSALMSVEASTADLSDGNQDGVVGGTGDDVEFRVLVRNTGFVALTGVEATASLASPAGTLPPLVCTPPLADGLAAGSLSTCTATYRITEADATGGKVVLDATSSATGPAGEAVASRTSTTVAVKAAPVVTTTTAPPTTTTTTESPSSSAPATSSTPASTSVSKSTSASASKSTSASAPKSSAAAAGAVSTPTTPLASTGASVRGITVFALVALLLGSVALLSLRGKRRSGN